MRINLWECLLLKMKNIHSIIKGKIFELEVDKPESVKDKNLTWNIKDSSIVTFAGKERHDDDIKFKALKAGTTKITCRNTKTDKKINFKITVKNVKKATKGSSQNKTIYAAYHIYFADMYIILQ